MNDSVLQRRDFCNSTTKKGKISFPLYTKPCPPSECPWLAWESCRSLSASQKWVWLSNVQGLHVPRLSTDPWSLSHPPLVTLHCRQRHKQRAQTGTGCGQGKANSAGLSLPACLWAGKWPLHLQHNHKGLHYKGSSAWTVSSLSPTSHFRVKPIRPEAILEENIHVHL